MNPNLTYYVLAFVAGLMLTVQVGVNSTLRHSLGSPMIAVLVSFVVGSLGLLCYVLLARVEAPARAVIAAVPAWVWLGGLLGAFYVTCTVIVAPKVGSASLLALSILGQLVAALVVDHYGWIGFPQHEISATRLAGAGLLFGGVLLIVR